MQSKRKVVYRVTLRNGDEINFTEEAFNREKESIKSKFTDHIESVKKHFVSDKEYERLVGEVPF